MLAPTWHRPWLWRFPASSKLRVISTTKLYPGWQSFVYNRSAECLSVGRRLSVGKHEGACLRSQCPLRWVLRRLRPSIVKPHSLMMSALRIYVRSTNGKPQSCLPPSSFCLSDICVTLGCFVVPPAFGTHQNKRALFQFAPREHAAEARVLTPLNQSLLRPVICSIVGTDPSRLRSWFRHTQLGRQQHQRRERG